jgi:hypothetical protein
MVNFPYYISVLLLASRNTWQAKDVGGSDEEMFLEIWALIWDS